MASGHKRYKRPESEPHPLAWLRAFVGPVIALGGWGVISTSYPIGVAAIYVGLGIAFFEVAFDPLINRKHLAVQISLMAVILFFFDWFTIGIVGMHAPIKLYAYAMRHGNYSDGVDVEGITWNSHFTELKVAITNPTDDDYHDLDLIIKPDTWVYEAKLTTKGSGCDPLLQVDEDGSVLWTSRFKKSEETTFTVTHAGVNTDVSDTQGNAYTRLASNAGYRLRCGTFPKDFTVTMIFATVAIRSDLPIAAEKGPTSEMSVWSLPDARSGFDSFDPKPSPGSVFVNGGYKRKVKPYAKVENVPVMDAN